MVDHIRALLLNSGSVAGCRHVDDGPADAVMARFGVTGSAVSDAVAVDRLLPLAMAPDLSVFRRFFDRRTTPRPPMSPYSQTDDTLSPSGLYASVLTGDGWWDTTGLFMSDVLSTFPSPMLSFVGASGLLSR